MKPLPPGYRFIDFGPSLTACLAALEHRAAQRFRDHGFAYLADQPPDPEAWRVRFSGQDIWVVAKDEIAVGFAAGTDLGDLYWLSEVSVDPDHGGKGIGRALVRKAIERANWAYHSAIGLSTFRNIPFNEPFYRKLGFVTVPCGERNASDNNGAQSQFWAELDDQTHPASRVLMLKRL